jgi:pyridoxal phosphate enzyme (YggS family)
VRRRVVDAARRAGRAADDVVLVGATKTVDVERIREAVRAGLLDLGENRAQELLAKAPVVTDEAGPEEGRADDAAAPRWHFLGALQRNKVRALVPWVTCWQSVDRLTLGRTIAQHAPGARVLVEVNLADEPQKAGCPASETQALVDELCTLGLDVAGLMTVPPLDDDPRPWFAQLRDLGDRLSLAELSMGMTDDFEVAIEEGATIVRVGRAIFGARPAAGR